MAGTFPQTYGAPMVGSVVQVASQFLGQSIIDSIRKQLPARKTQLGDAYMDGGRHLLRVNMDLINSDEKKRIELAFETARNSKAKLDACNDSKFFQRLLKAREYKCRSKTFFVVVKKASDRGLDDSLLDQIRNATGTGHFVGQNAADPFEDPPAPPLSRSSADTIEEIELTTYESERTGDVAVTMTLRGQGETTQDVMTTFRPEDFELDITEHGGPSITAVPASESNVLRDIVGEDEES